MMNSLTLPFPLNSILMSDFMRLFISSLSEILNFLAMELKNSLAYLESGMPPFTLSGGSSLST
ncbi:hypothetical protein RchiOBHm_Chr2g0158981 [Rosa chinensis]|uniref:Uncharacterized protein n=1 Tax=Rosa chinensis TaxID=74649 RepID=A0A2P6S243_ROSCH|nr:hypothetical protein RchiOBHm_Chr2g0158981 [Rosa chinensis]